VSEDLGEGCGLFAELLRIQVASLVMMVAVQSSSDCSACEVCGAAGWQRGKSEPTDCFTVLDTPTRLVRVIRRLESSGRLVSYRLGILLIPCLQRVGAVETRSFSLGLSAQS
jgi:hypothetical protein